MTTRNNKPDIVLMSQSLQDQVFELLKNQILDGELYPGEPLNTSELSNRLNVSRTPVRGAINQLVTIGLVSKTNYKEARVADYMSNEMYEIFSARSALESFAAGLAAKNMSRKKKADLVNMAERFRELLVAGDIEEFKKLDQDFHFTIYNSITSDYLKEIMKQLYMMTKVSRDTAFNNSWRRQGIVDEHIKLAQAIYMGDEKMSSRVGAEHHANTLKNLREKYENLRKDSRRI